MKGAKALFCILVLCLLTEANAQSSPVLVDSKGHVIGYIEGTCSTGSDPAPTFIVSRTGYYGCFNIGTGQLTNSISPIGFGSSQLVYASGYTSSDCSGQALAYLNGYDTPYYGGFVLYEGPKGGLIYADAGSVSEPIDINSNSVGGSACSTFSGATDPAIPALRNDINVTGISSSHYVGPFRVQVVPDAALWDLIFFDGFE